MMTILETLARGIIVTLEITVIATVIGVVLAIPVALGMRSANRLVGASATVWVVGWSSVPPIAWLLFGFMGLGQLIGGVDPMAAASAVMSVVASAYLARIFVSGLNAVPAGQYEAAASLGLPHLVVLRKVIAVQAARVSLPAAATYVIGLLKDTALVSVIGVQDITFHAVRLTRETGEGMKVFIVSGLLYILLSVPVALLARRAAARLQIVRREVS